MFPTDRVVSFSTTSEYSHRTIKRTAPLADRGWFICMTYLKLVT